MSVKETQVHGRGSTYRPMLSRSLDLETDEKMREVIRKELADCTVLAVAHRLGERRRSYRFKRRREKLIPCRFASDDHGL